MSIIHMAIALRSGHHYRGSVSISAGGLNLAVLNMTNTMRNVHECGLTPFRHIAALEAAKANLGNVFSPPPDSSRAPLATLTTTLLPQQLRCNPLLPPSPSLTILVRRS